MLKRVWTTASCWLDNEAAADRNRERATGVQPLSLGFFIAMHLACLCVFWVGWSWFAVGFAFVLYAARALFLTAFYHRYFSHRSYDTSRAAQFLFAVLGNTAAQRSALWWAAHHRQHHGHSDRPGDPHSPHEHTFYWSHMGWITDRENFETRRRLIPDLWRFPELRLLDRFDWVVPALFAAGILGLGSLLGRFAPGLGTNGPQLLVWGFFISTVFLFHVTCMVNSIAHWYGSRRFETVDQSRNNVLVALLAMGEGWHNNHHHFPRSTRQGFYWWEIDVTFYVLKALAWIGLVWDLTPVPQEVLDAGRGKARSSAP